MEGADKHLIVKQGERESPVQTARVTRGGFAKGCQGGPALAPGRLPLGKTESGVRMLSLLSRLTAHTALSRNYLRYM